MQWWCGCLLVLCGCSSVSISTHPPPQALELVGVFVYPFGFRWDEPAYRSFELSQRLTNVGVAEAGDVLSLWGPGEFRVMRADDDAAWVATTALPLLSQTGARPDQGIIVRPWAEQRVSSSLRETSDAKGRQAGAANAQETVYIGHVEIVHPASHEPLLEAEAQVKVDPFADPGPDADFDPAPALTALMERLMRESLAKVKVYAGRRTAQELPKAPLAYTPAAALHWSDGARPSSELELAKMDAAQLDLFLQARARYLNPKLSDLEAAKLMRLHPGLRVMAPGFGQLSEGDLITTIDGQPAAPQVWARLRFSPQVPARVKKPSGEVAEVMLP